MSYCVNCGVELDRTAKRCALCATEVVNPRSPVDTQSPRPFPGYVDRLGAADSRFSALFIVMMWALPSAICVAVNLLFHSSGFWAAYPVGALGLVFLCAGLPALFRRVSVYVFLLIGTCGALAYLYLIELLGPTHGWWAAVALPITLAASASVFVLVALGKNKVRPLYLCCIGMLAPAAVSVAVETTCLLYITGAVTLRWSVIVTVVCLSISLLCLAIGRNSRAMAKLQRRMHI
jgi:hypothetical protein